MTKLALYQYPSCPYCRFVLNTIAELDIEVELRDVLRNQEYMRELIAARGRRTVPVLRIFTADDEVWLPESEDIVDYLRANFSRR